MSKLITPLQGWPTLGQAVEGAAIDAKTDTEAVMFWLHAKAGRSLHTFQAYRREASRLLLWLSERHLSLAKLKIEHVHVYYAHLAHPPQSWIMPRKMSQHTTRLPTQTLLGPLSNQAINYARNVLAQMCHFLQNAGYLRCNVFHLSAKLPVTVGNEPTRLLDLDSWYWLWRWILARPGNKPMDHARNARIRWVFALLYHTGIRREEVAYGCMGNFVRRDHNWLLRIQGKGRKEKFVTVNSSLLSELVHYRQSLKLTDYPTPGEVFPLVASVNAARQRKPLSPRAIGLLIQTVAKQASMACDDEHHRVQISHMSTHWLRHTHATHRLLAGASLETTQDELGHADPRTTRLYAKINDARRKEDAEKLAKLSIEKTRSYHPKG